MMRRHRADVFEHVDPHSSIAWTINSLRASGGDRRLAREYLRDTELEVLTAHARQMRSEHLVQLFGLIVSALARSVNRLAHMGDTAARDAAAGAHGALARTDR